MSLSLTAIEHFHAELSKTNICCVTRRLYLGIIQARCSCCLLDNNFIIICRSLWLFASFDRKVSTFFFFKHSLTTCKSTSLSIECCRSLIAWLVKFIKNEPVEIADFSGGIAYDFSVGVTKQKNLSDLVSCSNGNK